MDVPGRPEPTTMTVEFDEQDGYRTQIVLHQTCDTATERDMAEQGSTMLLYSLSSFLTAQTSNCTPPDARNRHPRNPAEGAALRTRAHGRAGCARGTRLGGARPSSGPGVRRGRGRGRRVLQRTVPSIVTDSLHSRVAAWMRVRAASPYTVISARPANALA
ncbi:hypothetical protein [Streptomyces griseoluteus]|uniref:hypothetical protein n=1 Tax=Streptomyces griseoluteus TaxID=29306 RepID=UPI003F4D3600